MNPPASPGETNIPSYQYTHEQIATMARLGLVMSGVNIHGIKGVEGDTLSFVFIADSPLGRAKGDGDDTDYDLLSTCVEDAMDLTYATFIDKYPSLAPYND